MKRLLLLSLLFVLLPAANGHRLFGNIGAPVIVIDDNALMQVNVVVQTLTPNHSTSGRTPAIPSLTAKTLVLIAVGQSIGANTLPTNHTPTNASAVLNASIYGGIWLATDPLLGTPGVSGGNYNTYLADKLVTDGKFAQVIIVPVSVGDATVLDWSPTGNLHARARAACLMTLQWAGNSHFSYAMIFDDGQSDGGTVNGVTPGTTAVQWETRYAAFWSAMSGYGCPYDTFVPLDTLLSGSTSATIRTAQGAVVDGVHTFAGPDIDSFTGANRNMSSDPHLSDLGGSNVANAFATILENHY